MVGVLLENPKTPYNVGSVIRAMAVFEGDRLRWTGDRVLDPRRIRTSARFPREERMKDYAHIDWQATDAERPLDEFAPAIPVCVEFTHAAQSLIEFEHPAGAVYVFGPEDSGVSKGLRAQCHRFVCIPSKHCLNLAAAVNVVLYDRLLKS